MIREDWIECTFENVIKYSKGKKPKNLIKNSKEEFLPYINIKAFEKNIIEEYSNDLNVNFCNKDDLLMVWDGARAGYTGKSLKGIVGSTLMKIEPVNDKFVDKNFIFYFLKSLFKFLNTNTKGVGIPHVEPNYLWKREILLPPLPIQRAIVKKIEQLFSALDAGIADLKKAQEQLNVYRQAVLKKAFENIKNTIPLSEAGTWKGGGTPSTQKKDFWENGNIPWVSSQDVKSMYINDTERKITNIAIESSTTKWIDRGALLFVVRSGILRRVFPISIANVNLCVNQDIQTVTLKNNFISEFLYWFLTGNEYNIRHSCAKDGTTVESIDVYKLKNYEVPLCSIEKQQQVVKEIEARLSVCDAVEQQIHASLQQSEALRQSILKKAFAGELLTKAEIATCKKEPDYEPASVLLERIKEEKEKDKTKISKKVVRQKAKPAIAKVPKVSADIHAGLIGKIIKLHEANFDHKDKLSHIKCEKIAHLVEYHVRVPLGRQPVKDAAGPDDYRHLKNVESRAAKAGFFKIKKNKIGYTYTPGNNMDKAIGKFESSISDDQNAKINELLQLFLPFDLEMAEIAATTYAGWNNLIILGNSNPFDEEIVTESRENWSERKLGIPRERFFKAIKWMRKKEINLIPTGYGSLVSAPAKKKK